MQNQVVFQYYAGPEILTLNLKSYKLRTLKRLIASE
jgi:hypothetical protein